MTFLVIVCVALVVLAKEYGEGKEYKDSIEKRNKELQPRIEAAGEKAVYYDNGTLYALNCKKFIEECQDAIAKEFTANCEKATAKELFYNPDDIVKIQSIRRARMLRILESKDNDYVDGVPILFDVNEIFMDNDEFYKKYK